MIFDLLSLRKQLIVGLTGGLIFVLIFVLIFGLSSGLSVVLIFGLSSGLSVVLIFGLIGGLSSGLIVGLKQDLQIRSRPNQGIWNSLQSMLWTTVLIYPLTIVFVFFTFGGSELFNTVAHDISQGESGWVILSSLWSALLRFLVPNIFGALFFGFLIGGGLACVQHVCLRFLLWRSGVAPWNLARFLNYCVERRLLQRVGGRYRFLHRELLDYFAR